VSRLKPLPRECFQLILRGRDRGGPCLLRQHNGTLPANAFQVARLGNRHLDAVRRRTVQYHPAVGQVYLPGDAVRYGSGRLLGAGGGRKAGDYRGQDNRQGE
jgi:hypothetical protein